MSRLSDERMAHFSRVAGALALADGPGWMGAEAVRDLLAEVVALRGERDEAVGEAERLRAEMGYHEAKDVIEQLAEQRDDAERRLAAQGHGGDVEPFFKVFTAPADRDAGTLTAGPDVVLAQGSADKLKRTAALLNRCVAKRMGQHVPSLPGSPPGGAA